MVNNQTGRRNRDYDDENVTADQNEDRRSRNYDPDYEWNYRYSSPYDYERDYDVDWGYRYGRGVPKYGNVHDYTSEYARPYYGAPHHRSWRRGRYWGRGPSGYQRSDDRIFEDVNDRLTWHGDIDATNVRVTVNNGEVTLEGRVGDRRQKRLAEDIAEDVWGVKDIHNRLVVDQSLREEAGAG